MTLREFFDYLGAHPQLVVGFFLLLPLTAWFSNQLGRGEGHLAPWKYLYAALIYGACVPGIFAVALSVYFFIFERGSLYNANVLTQVLPIASMILTLAIIRRNVSFDAIPGFERLSSLMMMIASVFVLMYFIDRTHLIAFVQVPVGYLLLIVGGMLLLFRYGLKQLMA